uniref:Uncharacterized protein n=1 Tax=viral metagenome TaxID=1070528 RepID=A0A6C0LTD2_9ZZZZ
MPYVPRTRNGANKTTRTIAHAKNYRNNTPAVIEMGNLDEVPSTPLQNISLVRKYMPPGCCAGMMSEAHDVHVEHKFGTYRSRNWSCFTMKIKDAKSKWYDICVCWYCYCMPTACACLCKKDIEGANGNYYVGSCCSELVWASDDVMFARKCLAWSSSGYNRISPIPGTMVRT